MTPPTKAEAAEATLAWLRCAGVLVKVVDGKPRLRFPDDPTIDRPEVMAEIAAIRADVIALLDGGFRPHVPCLDEIRENREI